MIEIPEDIEQWTYGKIVDLINEGYDENDILEFKREINTASERLCKTACAFANTNGGTIIFGIDNDRQTPMNLHDRIIGIEDSDGLKRTIIDKINNIHPNIPIKNTVFRKSNIKLPNNKVIIILKITPSNSRPHQYDHIFYKRLVDGNEPMDVTEVKQIILESQKNEILLTLLLQECGLIQDRLNSIQRDLDDNDLYLAINSCKNIPFDTVQHFMFNQSFLYSDDTTQTLMRLIEVIDKLSSFLEQYEIIQKLPPEKILIREKQLNVLTKYFVNEGLKHLTELENHLHVSLIPIHKQEELRKELEEIENSESSNKS